MKAKVYRSVSNWPRDIVFKLEYLQDLLLQTVMFLAEKQAFDLKHFKNTSLEISVKYVADHEMKQFNGTYRQQDKPTNVLSFPIADYKKKLANLSPNVTKKQIYLGDIVFSYQKIRSEAEEQDKTIQDHVTHLFVHSVFHLIGFDHIKKADQTEMEALEVEFLDSIGIHNIYD